MTIRLLTIFLKFIFVFSALILALLSGLVAAPLYPEIEISDLKSNDHNNYDPYSKAIYKIYNRSGIFQSGTHSDYKPIFYSYVSKTENDPVLKFKTSAVISSEERGRAVITVELVEGAATSVEADLVFLQEASTASLPDIDNYTTQSIRFGPEASAGETKTVSIAITDDQKFEGDETAVFQLKNITHGSIADPAVLTLTIRDNDTPEIVINEIYAAPDANMGDADGNGTINSGDAFIEFVNYGSTDIDISGWRVTDAEGNLRHLFPPGTVIFSSKSLVLFGSNSDSVANSGGFGGAIIQTANEYTELSLRDRENTIVLSDRKNNTVLEVSYISEEAKGRSLTRSPDVYGSFIRHSEAAGSEGALFSPGTKVNGTSFDSKYAVGLRGGEGWYMISSPTQHTSFNDLFQDLWTQGINGADLEGDNTVSNANIITWSESKAEFISPSNMAENLSPGKGYAVFVFDNDNTTAASPQKETYKIINSENTDGRNNPENVSPVTIKISATDDNGNSNIDGNEGWNLLGNPFGTPISVANLLSVLSDADNSAQSSIQVWDQQAGGGQGAFIEKTEGDRLAPFQAFWIRYTSELPPNTEVIMDKNALSFDRQNEFLKHSNRTVFKFNLSLHDKQFFDRYYLEFGDQNSLKSDRLDAYKIFSLNPEAINLYSIKGGNKLLKNSLPQNLNQIVEIPLAFEAPTRQQLTFRWEGLQNLPPDWEISLTDRKLDHSVNLKRESEYRFNVLQENFDNNQDERDEPLYKKTREEHGNVRFILTVKPESFDYNETDKLPESTQLNPNYPNPFNSSTTISYTLGRESNMKLTVWNIVGQKVATLVDGVVEAGTHEEIWSAANMPSGIYIVQMEVESEVYIRKMTLIK